jgi:hypothetical protein
MNAAERLYLTANGDKVVPENDPDAAYLLAAEGNELDAADVKRLGIKDGKAPRR